MPKRTVIDQAALRKLTKALEVFKEVDPTISLPSILAYLYYLDDDAQSGNRHRVERRLGLSNATGSRATLYWADYKAPRVPGKGFLEQVPDPDDRRYQIITLTRKGVEFAQDLEDALKAHTPLKDRQ